ncbi:MAG: tetratricopeptide repeat protein [Nocardioidaceae bacterium]
MARDDNRRSSNRSGGGPGSAGRPDRRRSNEDRSSEQQVYDGPELPEDVVAGDLDKMVLRGLSSLPDRLADRVARHLVMAGRLIDDDPEVAYQHALAARARATRVAVVREAVGETAYAAGKYAEALSELRAAKRLNGVWEYLPIMADCERALKRPERAITLDTEQARAKLSVDGQVELSIVVAGARRDLGQAEAAVRLLESESLLTKSRADWVARLRYAYADALLAAGRSEDALEWFHRTVAVDGNTSTDATERIRELEPNTGAEPAEDA